MTTESATEKLNKEIMQWGFQYLTSHGYTLKNNLPEEVQNTPWSYVVRFITSDGYIYLKHTPELLALEPAVIEVLRKQFHASIPNIIAQNTGLNCFLMKDSGTSLRVILKQKFDEALLCKAIDQFISLQLTVAERVDVFLGMGVPDWRINKFPDLYKELLSQKKVLIADGLTESELNQLEALAPKILNLCQTLSDSAIKPTIVQPDFNDNNTLVDTKSQNITFIDLGEIAISHPFFSLINCLHVIKKHHAITDEIYLRIKDAALKNYLKFESKNHIAEAFEIAQILFHVYGALGSFRLMLACDQSKFTVAFQRHGRPSMPLKELLTVLRSTQTNQPE